MMKTSALNHVTVSGLAIAALLAVANIACAETADDVVCNGCVHSSDIEEGTVDSANIKNHSIKAVDLKSDAVFRRTIIVSPVGDGSNPIKNGRTLRKKLESIKDNSGDNPYLVKLEPGIYDIGDTSLQMKSFVDIEGSGQDVTRIIGTVESDVLGVIELGDHTELRALTVVNAGTTNDAIVISAGGVTARVVRVTANVLDNGGFNDALLLHTGSSVWIRDSEMLGADGVNTNGDADNALYIINSQVRSVFAGSSKLACVGAYDINYAALNSVCSR